MKKFYLFAIALTFLTTSCALANGQFYSQNIYSPSYPAPFNSGSPYQQNLNQINQPQFYTPPQQVAGYASPLYGNVTMVPTNTSIDAVTSTRYSTSNMYLGQQFNVVLPNGFTYGNQQIAPAGSTICGTVIDLKRAGHATRNARLEVKFTSIVTPMGQTIPITAKIKTDDSSGILYGGTKMTTAREYAKDATVGAASGAVLGTVMGALSGGEVGRGAAYGTAVGAGAGFAKSLWDKGAEIDIPANTAVEVVLEQPLTVSPIQYH